MSIHEEGSAVSLANETDTGFQYLTLRNLQPPADILQSAYKELSAFICSK